MCSTCWDWVTTTAPHSPPRGATMPDAGKNVAAYGSVEINEGESLITQTEPGR